MACSWSSHLSIALGSGYVYGADIFTPIEFTNLGNAPCTLTGYPGVSVTTAAGTQIGEVAQDNPYPAPAQVTLAPGAIASARLYTQVSIKGYPVAQCKPQTSAYLKIYLPHQGSHLWTSLPFKTTVCSTSYVNVLAISVVTAGIRLKP